MDDNILETKNYDMFKFGAWNRSIKERNLSKLDREVQKNGWKKHPIIVNDQMEIIDGQHRYVYAKSHDLPIYYIVVNGLTVQDCVLMNNSRMAWMPNDFIKLYASQGNENYVRLKELADKYTFVSVSQIVSIIKNQCSNGNLSDTLRKGEYTLTEEESEKAKAKLDYIKELMPLLNSTKGRKSALIATISFCYDNEKVDNDRLKTQIENRIATMIPPANIDMALQELEKIYNYRLTGNNYVYITTEYKKHAQENMTHNVIYMNNGRRRNNES